MSQVSAKKNSTSTDIAIVGAGPYGLSIAAHLRSANVDHRIIGFPMKLWAEQMPKGMLLKSDGFGSNLYDPGSSFTLRSFCEEQGIEYADVGIPVHLETFCAYGMEFQRRFIPNVQSNALVSLRQASKGFLLQLDNGESFTARNVVIATGLSNFQHIPEELALLPSELVSHSSQHTNLERFKGQELAVIGGGASAIDLAVLLHECGAIVHLVSRQPSLQFHDKMKLPRPIWEQVRHPLSALGPGWRPLLYAEAPLLSRWLPDATRPRLGPSGGWFVRDPFAKVPHLLGYRIKKAEVLEDRVHLHLIADSGAERVLRAQHVIAATGYQIDLRRLPFLNEEIRSQLKLVRNSLVLSSTFESSLPGLYFVGCMATNDFGPIMRFAAGAKFTARQLLKRFTRAVPTVEPQPFAQPSKT